MALVSLPGLLYWPTLESGITAPAFGNMLLDAANEKAGAVIEVPKAGSIRKIHFRTGTVTTGDAVDVRVETVNASGDPSGTLWAANTNGSQTILFSDDSTWFTTTLTADATVAIGDRIGVVIALSAVPVGNLNISRVGVMNADLMGVPYTDLFTASWAKGANKPCIALEYSDSTFSHTPNTYPVTALTSRTYNSGSSPDERGIKFQVPFKCRTRGLWWRGDTPVTAGTLRGKLYDSGGTLLVQTPSEDHDYFQIATTTYFSDFTAPQTLDINTVYRLTLLPETTTNLGLYEFSVNAAGIMDCFAGGQNVHLTTRTDAGSFTDTTTQRALMGLLIDQLDDGAGGASPFGGSCF